jgi:hypothetical protein
MISPEVDVRLSAPALVTPDRLAWPICEPPVTVVRVRLPMLL